MSAKRIAPFVEGLAAEFGDAMAALTGATTTALPIQGGGEAGWVATLACSGSLVGTITLGLTDHDLRRVCASVLGMAAEEVTPDAALDTLRELCNQTIGALSQRDASKDVKVLLEAATAAPTPTIEATAAFEFPLPDDLTPRLFVRADLITVADPVAVSPAPAPRAPEPVATPGPVSVPSTPEPGPVAARNLDVLLDIELPVTVRFGRTELPLLSLVRLGPGSVIDLHRSADEPVDVLVSGKVVARGEVVVVEGNYGVRVTEIVSTAERIRSMGA